MKDRIKRFVRMEWKQILKVLDTTDGVHHLVPVWYDDVRMNCYDEWYMTEEDLASVGFVLETDIDGYIINEKLN